MKPNSHPSTVPLARDANGNVISLPDAAAAWGVRRHTGGRPRNVIGLDRRPLRLPLDATIDDIEAMLGPGAYRLDLVDDAGAPLGVTVPMSIGDQSHDDDDDDRPTSSRVETAPPPLVTLPTSGTDLRLLLEANVRAMQLSFHHNERTLETSLRAVDSLRDGVRVLADAQANWIKALASTHTIRNAPYWPPTRAKDDDDEEDDDDGDEDDDYEDDPSFWQQLGENLNPYAPLIFSTVKDKIAGWVGGVPIRNAKRKEAARDDDDERSATADHADEPTPPPAPPPKPRKKQPSRAELMGMVAQKISAAQKLLTEEEIARLRQRIASMPAELRDEWVMELAPLSVEDAIVVIREALSYVPSPPEQPAVG